MAHPDSALIPYEPFAIVEQRYGVDPQELRNHVFHVVEMMRQHFGELYAWYDRFSGGWLESRWGRLVVSDIADAVKRDKAGITNVRESDLHPGDFFLIFWINFSTSGGEFIPTHVDLARLVSRNETHDYVDVEAIAIGQITHGDFLFQPPEEPHVRQGLHVRGIDAGADIIIPLSWIPVPPSDPSPVSTEYDYDA